MKVSLIGCPFQTSYGYYIQRLAQALGAQAQVRWIASNCGCGDPVERERKFITDDCSYFEWPVVEDYRSADPLRRKVRFFLRHALNSVRARRYEARVEPDNDIEHFQQTLNAYGSDVAMRWLGLRSRSRRVITVHELDEEQRERPQWFARYNLADAVLVHDRRLGAQLESHGVDPWRIHLVRHGAHIPDGDPLPRAQRQGLVFYGGHKPMVGKGLDVLMQAYAAFVAAVGPQTAPRLLIHGHYGLRTPPQGLALAERFGVAEHIDWLNQIDMEEMESLYAGAWACVLPYSGSFAGLPASTAAARGLPVIGTRMSGIPEHLDEHLLAVEPHDADALAHALLQLHGDQVLWARLSRDSAAHARRELSWQTVAADTAELYAQLQVPMSAA